MKISELALQQQPYIVRIRRELHRFPELSFKEEKTSFKIFSELEQLGIPYEIVGDYGIVATIEGSRSDRMVALRADMDALPINEETDVDYKSTIPNVMHACGHDGHVAMLLGAARILNTVRSELHGTVKLCFQQAEEFGGGTKAILDNLSRFPVKTVFGIHLWSEIETGRISVEAGPRMAAGEGFEIVVHGKGCHGANPDRGIDPIIAACAIVQNAAVLISRELNPLHGAALTFGKIQGGDAPNVIPEKVVLAGTMRNTSKETQIRMRDALTRIVRSTAETYRVTAELTFRGGVPVVFNDPACSAIAIQAAEEVAGKNAIIQYDTMMASENYGDFLDVYPGVFALIGVRNETIGACYPHHHPKFNIDEEPLWTGAAMHAQYTINYFNQ